MVDIYSGFSLRILNDAIYDNKIEVVEYLLKIRKEYEKNCNKVINIHKKEGFGDTDTTPILSLFENYDIELNFKLLNIMIEDGANLSDKYRNVDIILVQSFEYLCRDVKWEVEEDDVDNIKYKKKNNNTKLIICIMKFKLNIK